MCLAWNNVNVEVLNKNKNIKLKYIDIVKNSSGEVKRGEILAIMGPSGGGKTTLLNALSGRIPIGSFTQGTITYNNKTRKKDKWLKRIGVVDQDDVVHEDLTVEQTLRYAAMFRLKNKNYDTRLEGIGNTNKMKDEVNDADNNFYNIPGNTTMYNNVIHISSIHNSALDSNSNNNSAMDSDSTYNNVSEYTNNIVDNEITTKSENAYTEDNILQTNDDINNEEHVTPTKIKNIVHKIIKDLKLENVSQNEISKISGGERKRVMIGIELVTDPQIIFLDEPTSGLDTLTALKIIKILKNLAVNKNIIVILTIHQPSQEIFYMFDKLLLLSEGNTIYAGMIKDAERFFEDKQIKKRPQITFPEFIVEICSEDFRNENPSLFYCEGSIFTKQALVKCAKIRKRKNDFYITFMPSLRHSLILLSRKLKIDANRKTKFVKSQISKMVAYFMAIFLQTFFYKIYTTNPNILATGMEDLAKHSTELYNVLSIAMLKTTFLTMTIFIVFFVQISTVIPSFYDEARLVKREIAVGSYSTGSYFVSLLLYNIIMESFLPLISFCLVSYLLPIADLYIFIAYMCSSFFTIPFALCIASISTTKQFVLILSSLFSSLTSIPPSTISSLNEKFGVNSDGTKNILNSLTYLCAFITPYFYVSLLSYFSCSSSLDDLYVVTRNPEITKVLKDMMLQHISFIDSNPFNIFALFCITFTTPFLCIIVGIFLLNLNLMPNIRMSLEKKKYDKTA
ncbi:hypothetical protein BDAP_001260 [Binucleata daphniae]